MLEISNRMQHQATGTTDRICLGQDLIKVSRIRHKVSSSVYQNSLCMVLVFTAQTCRWRSNKSQSGHELLFLCHESQRNKLRIAVLFTEQIGFTTTRLMRFLNSTPDGQRNEVYCCISGQLPCLLTGEKIKLW
jgi:hypothetical protein